MNFSKNNISSFHYDPFGRRILKISKPCSGGVPDSDQTTWTFTYYVNDASGNVMATYDYKRTISNYNISLDEQMIYGSSRLGMRSPLKLLSTYYISGSTLTHEEADSTRRWCGLKRYEYTNHLGNVLLVTTDRKMGIDANSDGSDDFYHAVVDAYYDYGPFGNVLDGRTGGNYRYNFNGTEVDQEMYNNSASHDFGARMYNANLGRFMSVDPYESHFAFISPYSYAQNNPVRFVDLGGMATGDPIKAKLTEGCQSLIIVLKDGPDDYNTATLELSSWDYIIVDDIRDAADYLKEKAPWGYNIENLDLITHGGEIRKNVDDPSTTIGYGMALHDKNWYFDEEWVIDECVENGIDYGLKTNLSEATVEKYLENKTISTNASKNKFLKESCDALATIGSYLSDESNVVFGGCNLGQNKNYDNDILEKYGELLLSKNNSCKNVNLYFNNDLGTNRTGSENSQTRGVKLNKDITNDANFFDGWDEYKISNDKYIGKTDYSLNIRLMFWPGIFDIHHEKKPTHKPQLDTNNGRH